MSAALSTLKAWLEHPLTRGRDLDDPSTTALRREIIAGKPFLRRIYVEWYEALAARLPATPAPALELGSGAGFLKAHVPNLITSDIFPCPGVDRVVDALDLPFPAGALRGIVMTNVFHHLPDAARFLHEAARCVQIGGRLVLLEPWMTTWSYFVYTHLHHEPMDLQARDWKFATSGPLSGANGALPWIVFQRDRALLARDFPQWRVLEIKPLMPFRYLVSGGISLRTLAPAWTFPLWRGLETLLTPLMPHLGMFALIVVERVAAPAAARAGGG